MHFTSNIYGVIIQILLIIYNLFYTTGEPVHGRYTRNLLDYQLVIPRKLDADGSFLTYNIPHFFEHEPLLSRKKRFAIQEPNLKYGVTVGGEHFCVELWPNHDFLSANAVFERSAPNKKVQERQMNTRKENLCYYLGRVRNKPKSRAAISTCDGLSGYITVDGRRYFIEPVAEHSPNVKGLHLHLIHDGGDSSFKRKKELENRCGTNASWTNAWKERFYREYGTTQNVTKVKRGLTSVPRYLETMIVADKKFLEHHKNTDINSYVLTIMNMVSDFYHDASTGNQLDVVVVRLMFLEKEEEEIDLTINANADDSLASFCKWQQTVNPKDIRHPNHHDIAVLLTRYDICADNLQSCGLMGLAYVASACTGDKPCAINEDTGLMLGIVVAHEMGHVMGCSHDKQEESGCKSNADDGSFYVMSPYVHLHTNIWSTCSKTFITELFDNNLGECLNDEPQESIYKETGMLPGSMYDGSYQCNLLFPGSTVCIGHQEKFCIELYCQTTPSTCMSNGEPPADGTKCAENKWCYDTKCVEIGERPQAINGGWDEWGSWSSCSRTCGAGVSYSERHCNNPAPKHRGRYCLGERKKVKLCNTQPCAEGAKPFRAAQCSEFDSKPFRDKLYKWEPFMKDDEPCGLFCINTDKVYSKLAPRAKDGTNCKRGTRNMCISGTCKKVGCDYTIDSDAVDDDCGICKGDGTQCKLVDEMYSGAPGHGYVKLVTIPKGSRNIYVEEQRPSDNTIAVSAVDEKKFYLNGEFSEQQDGDHDVGGVEGVYSHPEPNKETFLIYGPLKEDIVLFVVYYANENVGYHYKYAEPVAQSNYQPHYHWEFVEWEECTVRCGGGVELAEAECIEDRAGKVSSLFCKGIEKPHQMSRTCNEQPCITRWRFGKWSNCSACKFKSGVRTREVECIREAQIPGAEDTLVDDDKCQPPKPGSRELCNSGKKCVGGKRNVDGFHSAEMQHLWFQTRREYALQKPIEYSELVSNPSSLRKARRSIIKSRRNRDNPICSKGNANATLRVGTIVDDKISPEQIKLKEVPLRQSHMSLNLTDAAFETMGDKISESLDTCKEKIYTGKAAVERMNQLQHKNSPG